MVVHRFTTEKLNDGRWRITVETPIKPDQEPIQQTFNDMAVAYDWLGIILLRSSQAARTAK